MSRCRVVYLPPSFRGYRLPVFDELGRVWPQNDMIIALANPGTFEDRRAISAELFDERIPIHQSPSPTCSCYRRCRTIGVSPWPRPWPADYPSSRPSRMDV